ncbi:hypothetical protein [Xenococcus sp. PCC 7305]|uniref:hypothetical protein n=1 Tax=Xenococcus sp. PCC 7305 TaxID=102125 RepID=UPI0002D4780A|nr:hypothetical protein [Xenococcus sp. PCC 7305]
MNISLLRQIWKVIEQANLYELLSLNDTEVITRLLGQLEIKNRLSREETLVVKVYLNSKLPLIKDLAESHS